MDSPDSLRPNRDLGALRVRPPLNRAASSRKGVRRAQATRSSRSDPEPKNGLQWAPGSFSLGTGKEKAAQLTEWKWWPGPESNQRHADFQSAALPTELPGRAWVRREGAFAGRLLDRPGRWAVKAMVPPGWLCLRGVATRGWLWLF